MACFVSAEPFLMKATQLPWGIKSCSIQEESYKDGEPGFSCTTSQSKAHRQLCGSAISTWARSLHLGLCHISKELLRVINHFCKGSWPDLQLPVGHWTKQPLLILPSEARSLETQNFRNSDHLPTKDNYYKILKFRPPSHQRLFYIVFNRTNTLLSSCFSLLFFLTADP